MFWDSTKDNTVDCSGQSYYAPYACNMAVQNEDGYTCDPLAPSPVVFLGSCDMSGPIPHVRVGEALPDPKTPFHGVWSRVLHRQFTEIHGQFPYIALSRIHCGMHSVIRRVFAYCEEFGPPKKLFLVMPRPVCIEIPIRGTLINVAERDQYIGWLKKNGVLTQAEHDDCMKAVEFARTQQDSAEYQLYQFEEIAAFLKLLCKAYNIDFRWTPNLAVAATIYFPRWMRLFLTNNPFMLSTCAGVGELKDFAIDASTGERSQASLVKVFESTSTVSLDKIMHQLQANKRHLIEQYPNAYAHALKLANREVE